MANDEKAARPELVGESETEESAPGWCVIQVGRGVSD
jgi:hypothetical protein